LDEGPQVAQRLTQQAVMRLANLLQHANPGKWKPPRPNNRETFRMARAGKSNVS